MSSSETTRGRQMYFGWIMAPFEAKEGLEKIGIVVGPYDEFNQQFDHCEVTPEALKLLDPCWGEFVWGLQLATNPGQIVSGVVKPGDEKKENTHSSSSI